MTRNFDSSQFKRRLARLPKAIRRNDSEAVAKNAAEWVAAAKLLAPKDPRDGVHLEPSIRHYETPTGGQVIRAGGETTTKPLKKRAGEPVDYAVQQEFGNQQMPASPFFWPPFRILKKRFAGRRARALAKALKEI